MHYLRNSAAFLGFYKKVNVIRQKNERKQLETELFFISLQQFKVCPGIFGILEDDFLVVPAGGYVINGAFDMNAWYSFHLHSSMRGINP
jgi:hypothetical protein